MSDADRRALLSHFHEEADEHIETMAKLTLSLEARPDDETIVMDLLRHAHSLKGASKLVGGTALERLTHALETTLAEVQAKHLSPSAAITDTILAAIDAMRAALARLMEGITDTGAEKIVSDLLSLAASGPNLDDRLSSSLPGLDAEIRDVLTEFQKSQLVLARTAGKTVWECELDAPADEFAARIDAAFEALKQAGDVVSLAGLSSRADDRLRFKFVLATRQPASAIASLSDALSMTLVDPTVIRAAPADAALSDEDAEFLAEMAKLIARYVSEADDELQEAATLILALEGNPDDAATVNTLFRIAHSYKGSGMTYGLAAVSTLAHQMETLLDAVRERRIPVTSRVTNALLVATDALKNLFARARAGHTTDPAPADVLQLLNEAVTGTAPAPAPAPAAPAMRAPQGQSESIRVRLGKLDRLVSLAGELTIVRNTRDAIQDDVDRQASAATALWRQWQSLRDELMADGRVRDALRERGWLDQFEGLGRRLSGHRTTLEAIHHRFAGTVSTAAATTEALQEAIARIRMVPIASLFDAAPRMIRDLTSDKSKQVELRIAGERTELDKRLLELMTDPLMHLLRNAVDHGIEPAAERRAAGKPPSGLIELTAQHLGGTVLISVRDDGRGLDPERLIASAVRKGIVAAADAGRVTHEQAYALIFAPGFSTKETVTAISGRGVGMDVVKSNIDALKGRIEIDSAVGEGTTFRIYLPLSISMIQVVTVECAGHVWGLPAAGISEIVRVADDDLRIDDGEPFVDHRGARVPIVRLSDLLGLAEPRPLSDSAIVIARGLEGRVGLVVDRAVSEQVVLVKELGQMLRRVPHVSGVTIQADGRVMVIADLVSLVAATIRERRGWVEARPAAVPVARKTLLVVDDSLTTRELIRGLLEAAGYDVVVARHGREAWDMLQSPRALDLVVSDVQMPEMNGFELTAKIKGDHRLSKLPVVLVTSLARPEERQQGERAGADAYIVKGAFDQHGLLARVEALVGRHG